MSEKTVIMDSQAIGRAITRISFEIVERNRGAEDLCLIGIMGGGTCIVKRIATKIQEIEGRAVKCGELDITCYRDDVPKKDGYTDRSNLTFPIDGMRVVLIDDVIFTGRSARAAIDAIMSRGRPKNIQLAILIDRGHRELPIRADFIGKNVPTSKDENVIVNMAEATVNGGGEIDSVEIEK